MTWHVSIDMVRQTPCLRVHPHTPHPHPPTPTHTHTTQTHTQVRQDGFSTLHSRDLSAFIVQHSVSAEIPLQCPAAVPSVVVVLRRSQQCRRFAQCVAQWSCSVAGSKCSQLKRVSKHGCSEQSHVRGGRGGKVGGTTQRAGPGDTCGIVLERAVTAVEDRRCHSYQCGTREMTHPFAAGG